MMRTLYVPMVAAILVAGLSPAAAGVTIERSDEGRYHVKLDGRLFTTLHTQEFPKPILYPIVGPQGVRMTRDYPMVEDTPGEARDHRHHQSLWFTHGDVNGVDFWALGRGAIETEKVEKPVEQDDRASIVLHDRWTDASGKTICTDTQKIVFHEPAKVDGEEVIPLDYQITIHASEGDVTFGDTKEGTMGIRTNPALRIDKGAEAVNSEGVTGRAIWGKRAKWVDYSAEVEGHEVGVSIFDHPSNPRHPTWWHARHYGLVAANPFGIHDFQGGDRHAGDMKIEKGKSVTFAYRFLFHSGDAEDVNVAARYAEWAD